MKKRVHAPVLRQEQGVLYRMQVAYQGSAFAGFQSQACGQAIADHLEKALTIILRHPVRVQGASRTDRGVHAFDQTVVFRTSLPHSDRWILGLNALLPKGIGVLTLEAARVDFHPIYDATAKVYRYRMCLGRCFDPFLKDLVWDMRAAVDLELLEKAWLAYVGRHDFRAFANKDLDAKTTVRTIYETTLVRHGPFVDLYVLGEGFLKQMVRIMVGTAVEISTGRRRLESITELFSSGRREDAGQTAPARGLTLCAIFYDKVPSMTRWLKAYGHSSAHRGGHCEALS